MKLAAEIELPFSEFWELTPYEFNLKVKVTIEKERRAQKKITLEYLNAMWTIQWLGKKSQHPKPLKEILDNLDKEQKKKIMTDEQMLTRVKVLNTLFGGEIKTQQLLRIYCKIKASIFLGGMIYGSIWFAGIRTVCRASDKKDGYKPQKNAWVWAVILIINIIILLFVSITLANVITLLALDSMILFGISIVSMIVNLVKKRKIGNDIKFIGISTLTFLVLAILLSTL